MKSIQTTALTLALLLTTTACAVTPEQKSKDEVAVMAAYENWRNAMASRDPAKVVELYDDDAVLVATLENKPILTQEDRLRYFTKLLKMRNLKVTPKDDILKFEGRDAAVLSGTYRFSYVKNGKQVNVPARFTFVFDREDEGWEIETHHSSKFPNAVKK